MEQASVRRRARGTPDRRRAGRPAGAAAADRAPRPPRGSRRRCPRCARRPGRCRAASPSSTPRACRRRTPEREGVPVRGLSGIARLERRHPGGRDRRRAASPRRARRRRRGARSACGRAALVRAEVAYDEIHAPCLALLAMRAVRGPCCDAGMAARKPPRADRTGRASDGARRDSCAVARVGSARTTASRPACGWCRGRRRPVARRVPYAEAVEEGLCVGWVDSRPGKLDEERSLLWFAPRKAGSGWSRPNKERVERLTAAGLMLPAGSAVVEAARADGSWSKLDAVEDLVEPDDLSGRARRRSASRGSRGTRSRGRPGAASSSGSCRRRSLRPGRRGWGRPSRRRTRAGVRTSGGRAAEVSAYAGGDGAAGAPWRERARMPR